MMKNFIKANAKHSGLCLGLVTLITLLAGIIIAKFEDSSYVKLIMLSSAFVLFGIATVRVARHTEEETNWTDTRSECAGILGVSMFSIAIFFVTIFFASTDVSRFILVLMIILDTCIATICSDTIKRADNLGCKIEEAKEVLRDPITKYELEIEDELKKYDILYCLSEDRKAYVGTVRSDNVNKKLIITLTDLENGFARSIVVSGYDESGANRHYKYFKASQYLEEHGYLVEFTLPGRNISGSLEQKKKEIKLLDKII